MGPDARKSPLWVISKKKGSLKYTLANIKYLVLKPQLELYLKMSKWKNKLCVTREVLIVYCIFILKNAMKMCVYPIAIIFAVLTHLILNKNPMCGYHVYHGTLHVMSEVHRSKMICS